MKSAGIKLEEAHHNRIATFYAERRVREYIWEVPEEMFLLDKKLFTPGVKVVDMGCGPALTIKRILGKAIKLIDYTGVDISKNLLRIAKSNIKNGKYIYGDMATIELPKNKFDILMSLGALHHCQNKHIALNNWITLVKPGGHLLFREPIYEYLKKGTGESPIEEGIKIDQLIKFIKKNKLRVKQMRYFSTNAFHLFNRIMIMIGLRYWQNIRLLWYPIVYIDSFLARFSKYGDFFKPQSFAVILQKT